MVSFTKHLFTNKGSIFIEYNVAQSWLMPNLVVHELQLSHQATDLHLYFACSILRGLNAVCLSINELLQCLVFSCCYFKVSLYPLIMQCLFSCHLLLGEVEDAMQYFQKCLELQNDVVLDRRVIIEASDGLQRAQVKQLTFDILTCLMSSHLTELSKNNICH